MRDVIMFVGRVLEVVGLAFMLVGMVYFGIVIWRWGWPSGMDLQPDGEGMIHHPVYGTYPKEVPYHEGMTIMPGQSATMTLELEGKPRWGQQN